LSDAPNCVTIRIGGGVCERRVAMTVEIGAVFAILVGALVLFVGGWVRGDVVALLVLSSLVIGGLLPAEEALSGFAS
jgi:hypothetical protein